MKAWCHRCFSGRRAAASNSACQPARMDGVVEGFTRGGLTRELEIALAETWLRLEPKHRRPRSPEGWQRKGAAGRESQDSAFFCHLCFCRNQRSEPAAENGCPNLMKVYAEDLFADNNTSTASPPRGKVVAICDELLIHTEVCDTRRSRVELWFSTKFDHQAAGLGSHPQDGDSG